MQFINQRLFDLGVTDTFAAPAVLIYVIFAVCAFALRAVIFTGYGARLGFFKLNAKELKSKSDLASISKGVLAKIVKDYANSCEKGVARINAAAIVKKHLLNQRLIYWTYDSVGRFILNTERALPILGVIFVLSFGNTGFFAIFTIIIFAVTRILAASFDFEHTYITLESGIAEYLEREVGRFFILDTSTGLTKLNKTIADFAARQQLSIEQLGGALSKSLKSALDEMGGSIKDTVKTINSYGEVLKKPLNEWNEAVANAANVQRSINESALNLKAASDSLKTFIVDKDSLNNAIGYIEQNQTALLNSLNSYELALEQITSRLGGALGLIIDHHIEASYINLNAQLSDNIDRIISLNAGVTDELRRLFAQMTEHMKALFTVTQNLKEQLTG